VKGIPHPTYLGNLQTILSGVTDPNLQVQVTTEFNENWYSGRFPRLMQIIAAWARTSGVRVMMNEMGIERPEGVGGLPPVCLAAPTDADRGRYLTDVRTAAEANGIAWNYFASGPTSLKVKRGRPSGPRMLCGWRCGVQLSSPDNLPGCNMGDSGGIHSVF